jgi:transposase
MARARRKFFGLHVANKSQIAEYALGLIGQLYEIEREAKSLDSTSRQTLRQLRSRPIADALFEWMRLQRLKITDGSATARVLGYTLK